MMTTNLGFLPICDQQNVFELTLPVLALLAAAESNWNPERGANFFGSEMIGHGVYEDGYVYTVHTDQANRGVLLQRTPESDVRPNEQYAQQFFTWDQLKRGYIKCQ